MTRLGALVALALCFGSTLMCAVTRSEISMRADDFDIPAGQPFRKVRDFLRAEREIFTPKSVVQHFGADITNELQAKGLIEPYVSPSGETISPDWFQVSSLGLRLANVRLIPRIPRAKAEKIVADMLARARAINDTPELLFLISKITVFGSFITDAKEVGDIDLLVEIKAKIGEPGKDRLGRRRSLRRGGCSHNAADHDDFLSAHQQADG